MNVTFVVPAVALLGLATALGANRWPQPPHVAVRLLSVVAAVTAGTVAALALTTAAGFVLGPARRAEIIEWCRIVPLHHEVGTVLGSVSLLAVTAMSARVALVVRRRRRLSIGTGGKRISILETERPMAYAVPGKPGCVVVSTGLLNALTPPERRVLFAHERAHLQQRHHRYLLIAALARAIVPLLSPLESRIRLSTERCADEEAAAAVDGDRRLVASAIAKAALTTSQFDGLIPAFSGSSVVERVSALIHAPSARAARTGRVVVVAGSVAAVGAGIVQFHHLWVLVDHVCHGWG